MSSELPAPCRYVTAAFRKSDHALACGQSGHSRPIQEEIWALPLPLPMFAYLVRPVGDGPFPLVIMNHGVSLNPTDRSFFPLVEFRDAAKWFAQRGYLVVAPVGTGYGAAAIDIPEHGLYGPFFSKVGKCSNPNFRAPGLAVAQVDLWIIDYMTAEKRIVPKEHRRRAVGRRMGRHRAFEPEPTPGQGGHRFRRRPWRPRRQQAQQQLRAGQNVEATGEFGPTSRVPICGFTRERYLLWPCPVQAHARGLYRGRRQGRISCSAAVRQRWAFLCWLSGRHPDLAPLVTKFLDEQG